MFASIYVCYMPVNEYVLLLVCLKPALSKITLAKFKEISTSLVSNGPAYPGHCKQFYGHNTTIKFTHISVGVTSGAESDTKVAQKHQKHKKFKSDVQTVATRGKGSPPSHRVRFDVSLRFNNKIERSLCRLFTEQQDQ